MLRCIVLFNIHLKGEIFIKIIWHSRLEMAMCRVVLFRVRVKFFSPEPDPLSFPVEIYKSEPVY